MKRVLKFNIDGQTISKDPTCNFDGLHRGTVGYLYARFSFSEEWAGCKKAASFYSAGKEYAAPVINGQCMIPEEALRFQSWKVSVTGMKPGFKITTGKEEVVQG